MADYHPLITRAVSALEKDTAENRRALYERARTALVSQLRGTMPPLDEAEITRERLALEEAIRRVEVKSARRAREAPPREPLKPEPVVPKRISEVVRQEDVARRVQVPERAEVALSEEVVPAEQAEEFVPVAPAAKPDPVMPPTVTPELAASEPPYQKTDKPGIKPSDDLARSEQASKFDEALKKIREVAGSLNRSGEYARTKVPRPTIAPVSAPPAPVIPQYPEPSAFPPPLQPAPPPSLQPAAPAPQQEPLDALKELASYEPGLAQEEWKVPPAEQARLPQKFDYADTGFKPPAAELIETAEVPARLPRPSRPPHTLRSYRKLMWICIVLVCILGTGALAYWQGGAIIMAARSLIASFRSPATQVQKDTTPSRQKNTDRIGQPDSARPSKDGAATGQRAMLTTEPDANSPSGKDYVGTANWQIETVPAGPGRPAEVAIKLEVEIPDRGFTMTWLIKRNTDATLPATHTIDIEFKIAENSSLGAIAEIRSLLMKQPNQTEGQPLWGHAQKSTPNYFLVGLSAAPADAQYNLRLLKEQGAFDIALVFTKANRAFLLIEKGPAGERVFADVFAAWKQ